MSLILTHEKTDFDAVASMLGAKKLFPAAVALLPRHLNRNVQQFLNLYWDSLPFVRPEDWRKRPVDHVILVDTQTVANVRGLASQPSVHVFDHHVGQSLRPGWSYEVEPVGATVTLLVERWQANGLVPSAEEATLLLLGIYEDTGSLTYDTTTARDARAAAWLLEKGAQLGVARRFLNPALSPAQQWLYEQLLRHLEWVRVEGRPIALAACAAQPGFDDEISSVAHRLRETLTPDGLFVLVGVGDGVQLVARSSVEEVDAGLVARELGGGGHSRAAAAMLVGAELPDAIERVRKVLPRAVQPMLRVGTIMSHGVLTVPTTARVGDVAALMQKHGHEGYPVVDERQGQVVGLLTRRAVDRAMAHGMGEQAVSRHMDAGTVAVRPSDPIERVQELMATEGWGQIPVIAEDGDERPIGIVTRTDLLNTLFKPLPDAPTSDLRHLLARAFSPSLWALVLVVSDVAARLKMPIYFVGGLVRDLLLGKTPTDLDIVVEGDAIDLVRDLRARFGGELHSHARFGTAKWSLSPEVYDELVGAASASHPGWHGLNAAAGVAGADKLPAPMHIDFVTARKEFYRRPTALPDVEPGSIKLDLHRRDFTINTLAIRLDGAHLGQLLDFYGGQRDLRRGLIRVLHSLSFTDDPTRILRAVRLEQRLGFTIEPGTAERIEDALPMLDRVTGERIRNEIELGLAEANPVLVMQRLDELGVLAHLCPGLSWRAETAAVYERIPDFAGDPLWGETFRSGPVEFYYFAVWLAPFDPPVPEQVARRLRVRKATLDDLLAVGRLLPALAALPADATPSAIVAAMGRVSPRVLLTARMLAQDARRVEWLDRYMAEWRHIHPIITGDDLRDLGLPPGPAYARILKGLLNARLDGAVHDEAGERALVTLMLTAQAR